MANVDFTQYAYYPALQCSVEEHLAYDHLSDDDKDAIIPIFELSQRGTENNLDSGIKAIKQSAGIRPFLLDLCKDLAPAPYVSKKMKESGEHKAKIEELKAAQEQYNSLLAELLDPSDGFGEWRQLAAQFENCIPVIQYRDAKAEHRHILRQGAQLSRDGSDLAIRITEEAGEEIINSVAQLIAILDDDAQLLVIIDCGQGRQRQTERAKYARQIANSIGKEIDLSQLGQVEFVCMSSTFKEPGKEGLFDYPGYDWDILEGASEAYTMMFGDYGAHFRRKRTTTYVPSDWKPMVVFPLDRGWIMYRHENTKDEQGWIIASKAIKSHESYSPLKGTWGQTILDRGAKGDIEGIGLPRFWRAAKSNMHMHRQIQYTPEIIAELIEGVE